MSERDKLSESHDVVETSVSDDICVDRYGNVYKYNLILGDWELQQGMCRKDTGLLYFRHDKKYHPVHLEVAKAYVPNPNPERFTEILHKNGDKQDNDYGNLMWVTPSEKRAWLFDISELNQPRPVFIECVNTQRTYESIAEVVEAHGISTHRVRKAISTGEPISSGERFREYLGTERLLFWLSNPTTWRRHPKYSNYLVSSDGFVVRLDADGGLGDPLRIRIRPDGTEWIQTKRKEDLGKLLVDTFDKDVFVPRIAAKQ